MSDSSEEIRYRLVNTFPLDTDLGQLVHRLRVQGVGCRVIEREGQQWLFVLDSVTDESLQAAIEQSPNAPDLNNEQRAGNYKSQILSLLRVPVVILVGVVTLVAAMVTQLGDNILAVLPWLIVDVRSPVGLQALEFSYRLWSPAFLHFGAMHLLFNGLWWWVLGGAIERQMGSLTLLILFTLGTLVSNLCQFVWNIENPLFGGLSGVLYTLVGFIAIWNRNNRKDPFPIPAGIIGFMILWLVLCMTGVLSMVGIHVANAAHVGGLLIGLLAGVLGRWRIKPSSI